MKLIFEREQLNKRLESIIGLINTRTGVPILDEALVKVQEGKIKVTVSDNEISTEITIPCEVEGDIFDFVCDVMTVQKTAALLRNETFILEVDEKVVVMSTPKTRKRFEIPIRNKAADFPAMPDNGWENPMNIKGSLFSSMVKRASMFIKPTDLRPAFTSINLLSTKDMIRIQGTDAHGLCDSTYLRSEEEAEFPELSSILFPKNIIKIVPNYEKSPSLSISIDKEGKYAKLSDDSTITQIRLTDGSGKYPDLDALFTAHNKEHFVKINRDQLLMAIRRMSIYSNKNTNSMIIDMNGDNIVLSADDNDFNKKAEELIEVVEKSSLMNFVSGINHNYLLTVINNMTGENVYIVQPNYNVPFMFFDDSSEGYKTMWSIAAIALASQKKEEEPVEA